MTPTLATVLATPTARLRLDTSERAAAYGTRPVTGLWPAGATPPPRGWRHVLAVIPAEMDPAETPALVRMAAHAGAAGIAAAAPVPDALTEAGRRHQIPVLVTTAESSWLRLAGILADLQHREAHDEARSIQQLLATARHLGVDYHTATSVLRWLALTIDGAVLLIDPHQPPGELTEGLAVPADRVAALATSAGPAADACEVAGWAVRMSTVGPTAPRHVLLAARRGTWDPAVTGPVRLTTEILDWWLRMRTSHETAYAHIRESLLQLLMSGQVLAAQRVAHPLGMATRLMDADSARVYVIGGPTARRDLLSAALHHRLGLDAVVVRCPVARRQTIIVAAHSETVDQTIRTTLTDFPDHCIGASAPTPLTSIGPGHDQATRALGPAASAADRYAVYSPEADIAEILPRDAAWRWATTLLAPVAPSQEWPVARREEWLWTLHLWLTYGTRGAVALTGSHRNTPRRRAAHLADVLGLDLEGSLAARVQLDLALRVDRLHPYTPPPPGPAPDRWLDLFTGDEVRQWADDFLGRVDPPLLDTLIAWITHGQHRETTAEALGISSRTLPGRLQRAEAQIRRPLISCPTPGQRPGSANGMSGVHDLVIALHVTRRLTTILSAQWDLSGRE